MANVTKSNKNNITSPQGNSLAVFVDAVTNEIVLKDIMGNIQPLSDFIEFPRLNYGLFAQIEDSVPVTATNVESSLIANGVGSLTVPQNFFSIGDSFNANFEGIISCLNSATLRIKVKTLDGILLSDTGIIDMDATTSKYWTLNLQFTVRAIGEAGVASISSGGVFSYIKNASNNFDGFVLSNVNNTTFDTTIDNTLLVTAQWNTNSASNSIFTRNFTLNKVY